MVFFNALFALKKVNLSETIVVFVGKPCEVSKWVKIFVLTFLKPTIFHKDLRSRTKPTIFQNRQKSGFTTPKIQFPTLTIWTQETFDYYRLLAILRTITLKILTNFQWCLHNGISGRFFQNDHLPDFDMIAACLKPGNWGKGRSRQAIAKFVKANNAISIIYQ